MPFTIAPLNLRDDLTPVLAAWAEAFAAPPNGPRYPNELRDQLYRHSTLPDFCGFVARDTPTNVVLGIAYGYTNAPGQWWRDRVAEAAGMQRAWNILHDTFCLTELGVVPAGRRQGIALALVNELAAHQPHARLLLSTRSDNHEGLGFYHATGWQTVLPKMSFGFGYPPYDILERRMRDSS